MSIGSAGSIASIGSAGSILSIGSAGSILSVGSAGSLLSIGSAGSILSLRSSGRILGHNQQPIEPGELRALVGKVVMTGVFTGIVTAGVSRLIR